MTATHRAIEDAVKGGFDKNKYFGAEFAHRNPQPNGDEKELEAWLLAGDSVFLAPDFWRAIGKQRNIKRAKKSTLSSTLDSLSKGGDPHKEWDWKANWHRLIDHLASGKDIESFFAELEASN